MFDEIKQQLNVALSGLKVFQLATVERLVEQFNDPNHSQRMLVADEVGLGKTVVAKGVIARLLEKHLVSNSHNLKPFRVTYICSNLALASENRQKLALFSGERAKQWVKQPSFGRLVELAVDKKVPTEQLEAVIEVCTLTPTTSFTLTAGSGNCKERAIISVLLSNLAPLLDCSEAITAFLKTDQITRKDRWEDEVSYIEAEFNVNQNVSNALHEFMSESCSSEQLQGHYSSYYHAAQSLANAWKSEGKEPEELKHHYFLFRVEVRKLVARCCAASLQADLFILDEFQRFQALTNSDSDSEESLIAQQVFHSSQNSAGESKSSKVLMLSATPFKAVTMLDEESDEYSHHQQLQHLLKFTSKEDMKFINQYELDRDQLHRELLTLADPNSSHLSLNENTARDVERLLQVYICRTERGQINSDFDQLISSKELICNDTLNIEEVKAYRAVESIRARLAELSRGRFGAQLIDFIKSAPWCMSFLQGYAFKKQFLNHTNDSVIRSLFDRRRKSEQQFAWLSRADLTRYKLNVETDTPNAKVRKITQTVFEGGAENLLWTPPAKAYYPFEGVFKGSESFTKTLLFSSWAVVPRVLSSLWSYESERRTLKGRGKKPNYNANMSPLLKFGGQATLNTWHLLYPCQRLLEFDLNGASFIALFTITKNRINSMLKGLQGFISNERSHNDWYLLAPILLDIKNGSAVHVEQWLGTIEKFSSASDDGDEKQKARKGRLAHINKIRSYIEQGDSLQLGKMPADLADVLTYSAIANPALCAQRTISNQWGSESNEQEVLEYTYHFADLATKLFNHEYANPIINRHMNEELQAGNNKSPAWFNVLVYCTHGNFQSMLDEFCHLLSTSGHSLEQAYEKLSSSIGIRNVGEYVHFKEDVLRPPPKKEFVHIRCHFAVSMGTQKLNDDNGLQRVVNVRDAFNSPFRPFVLSSTSIGQEGLDFHWYCRRVVHWNLPRNPIDIEQREGRVNRFKSYVIRKRLAEVTKVQKRYGRDVWEDIFEQAIDEYSNSKSGLEPFWFYSKGTTKIERIVPMYPMSKEVRKYQEILKILVLYRLAFGQPRQEELLENLLQREINTAEQEALVKRMMINLSPFSYSNVDKLSTIINCVSQ